MLIRTLLTITVLAMSLTASAAPFYEITHDGNTNPQDEGWRAIDIVASTQNEFTLPRLGIGPVVDGNVEAWQINNPVGDPSETSAYWATGLPGGNIFHGNHWQFSSYVKALPSDETELAPLNSAFRIMGFSRNYFGTQLGTIWMVTLEDIAQGGTRVRVSAGDGGNPVDIEIADGYHWIELIYDPNTGADLYIDGNLAQANVAYSGYAPIGNRVEFGDLQLVNGGRGGANWGHTYFAYDDEPFTSIAVPEPASAGLLLLGLVALGLRRKTSTF